VPLAVICGCLSTGGWSNMKLTRVLIERDGGALELDLIRVLAVTIVTHKLESPSVPTTISISTTEGSLHPFFTRFSARIEHPKG
jgi:hypothetical protein